MRIAGVLLGGGESTRFGSPKLEALFEGTRLVDVACNHFLKAGFDPVVFCGNVQPQDGRVFVVRPGAEMIETLRNGLRALPKGAFAFAPADMPALLPGLLRGLIRIFQAAERRYMIPVHEGKRGHPAFALDSEAFLQLGTEGSAREVWKSAGEDLLHHEVPTADVLFDIDTPADLAAAGDEISRRQRLLARGDLR
ncbi:MAG: nucleotidyltransferase family protein [Planctomycetota bacterium]|jgi:molybdenum cofactor cytidylyltransferase